MRANLTISMDVYTVHLRKKAISFWGASSPDPLTRGFAPGPRWGLRPQTPVIDSRSTRSPWAYKPPKVKCQDTSLNHI